MIQNIWQSITSAIYSLLQNAIDILPDSPFTYLAQVPEVYQVLKYINWLFPIDFFLSSMAAWLSAISIYYLISIILRWVKAID